MDLTPCPLTDEEKAAVATLRRLMIRTGSNSLTLNEHGPNSIHLQGHGRVGPVKWVGGVSAWTETVVDGATWVGDCRATGADLDAVDAAGAP